ncbi:MAG TPA: L,D-transpeptidase family protein [Longimicrobiales bacterium]|nr:L,D-transpeptidase family protein [Longimicrobiales bacterium]
MTPGRPLRALAVAAGSALLLSTAPAQAQLARELGLVPADEPAAASLAAALPTASQFALDQLRYERVRDARESSRFNVKRLFHERGIRYPAAEVFLRIFKRERSLELWVRPPDATGFALLKTYPICAMAGELGPKRRQGDQQTPEGFYFISFFNPRSEFYLSLHLDYPNRRDRASAVQPVGLGGDIYIHGGCNSEGCLAVTDEGIKELYWLAVETRAAGQQRIPVHIFPARLDSRDLEILQTTFADQPDLGRFWNTLKPGYDYFETHRRVPSVYVTAQGEYTLDAAAAGAGGVLGTPTGTRRPSGAAPTKPPLGTPVGGG